MNLVAEEVEQKIARALPNKFGLVFDGWSTHDNIHYCGLFATFPSPPKKIAKKKRRTNATSTANGGASGPAVTAGVPAGTSTAEAREQVPATNVVQEEEDYVELRYSRYLLAFAPIGDNDSLTAQSHYDFTTHVLTGYGKSWDNVVALIGDNCATNKAFARLVQTNFIGFASHRLNLAMKHLLEPHEEVIKNVQALMKKLKNILPTAKLCKLTPLRAKTAQVTRWPSTYEMLKRYFQLKVFLPQLNLPEIDDLLPSPVEERELQRLVDNLKELDEVTKHLQYETINLEDVRTDFDTIIELYQDMGEYLGHDAPIVLCKEFEDAIVKFS